MFKKYQYALVKTGNLPDFDKISGGLQHVFPNPVAVGDYIKPNGFGTELVQVVRVEHYEAFTILYYT